MSIFDKVSIRRAAPKDRPIDLSHRVITSQDFSIIKPLTCIEMVPGDNFHAKLESFVRLAPMVVPTFGRVKMVNRAFFVPFRLLMNGFNEFLTGNTVSSNGAMVSPSVVTINNNTIVHFFKDNGQLTTGSPESSGSAYDFKHLESDNVVINYKFTAKGKRLYDLFLSLGYAINWNTLDDTTFSALPLLAYCRIYLDYLIPSAYRQTTGAVIEAFMSKASGSLNTSELGHILDVFVNVYDRDYFTSAWQNPNSPGDFINNPGNLNALSPTSDRLYTGTSKDYNVLNTNGQASSGEKTVLTSYAHKLFDALSSFVERNNYSGSRAIEQVLSRFGVKAPEANYNRCSFLGSDVMNVQISDVMCTSDAGGGLTGEYAGKGIGYGNAGSFKYESKEFGYFIILSCIVPEIGYYQGRRRHTLHLSKLDFYTPEFDCVGSQPIRNDELFTCIEGDKYGASQQYGGNPNGIFGYSPRYSEYKYHNDVLTGDFRLHSMNLSMAPYHLFRTINQPTSSAPLALNSNFLQMKDAEQYNRIFQTTSDQYDHFYCFFNVNIKAFRPMHSIVDHLDIEGEGDILDVNNNGIQL